MTAANISVVMHGGATVTLDTDPLEDFIERLNEAKQKGVLLGFGAFPTTWINPDQVIVVQVNG